MVRIDKIEKSPIAGKKYRAYLSDGRKVDFGAAGYEHFKDKVGMYSSLDHHDPERRRKYRARHGKIKLKDGRIAKDVKYTPAWFSWHYLW